MIRLLFCGLIGLMAGCIPFFFEPRVGVVFGLLAAGFSWHVTEARPERGEMPEHQLRAQRRHRRV